MLTRKGRLSKGELYLESVNRDVADAAARRDFYTQLTNFYRRKWQCVLKTPSVNGVPIDLFKLYHVVVAFGGWNKVSSSGRWTEVCEQMECDSDIAVREYALKEIYMLFLSRFEHLNLVGNEHVDADDLGGRSRNRGRSTFTHGCPIARPNTNNPGALPVVPRANGECSSHYDRLHLSLLSGLPNEVDFAMNVCTLLSHPGPRFLRLRNSPQLVDALVATAGVFDDDEHRSLRSLYVNGWRELLPKRRYLDFWHDSILDGDLNQEHIDRLRTMIGQRDCAAQHSATSTLNASSTADVEHVLNLRSLTHDSRPLPRQTNAMCFRVYQVGSILRNLSFEPANQPTLANNGTLFKFLQLCIHSRWAELRTIGLDTLSNIASEMTLSSMSEQQISCFFATLCFCLSSGDKLQVMRACECVAALCNKDANEPILCAQLFQSKLNVTEYSPYEDCVLHKLCRLLCVKDIMLCVYVLEALLQLTELGETLCDQLATLPSLIETLVSMVTIEAVSFGVSGLQGMKVVEIANQHAAPVSAPVPVLAPMSMPMSVPHPAQIMQLKQTVVRPAPAQATPTFVQNLHHTPIAPHNTMSRRVPVPATVVSVTEPRTQPLIENGLPQASARPSTSLNTPNRPADANQNNQSRVVPDGNGKCDEQSDVLCVQWLRQHCEPRGSDCAVSGGELYAAYVQCMHSVHGALACSQQHFTVVLKATFPSVCLRQIGTAAVLVHGLIYTATHTKQSNSKSTVAPSTSTPTPAATVLPTGSSKVSAHHPVIKSILSHDTDTYVNGTANGPISAKEAQHSVSTVISPHSRWNGLNGDRDSVQLNGHVSEEENSQQAVTNGNGTPLNGTHSATNNQSSEIVPDKLKALLNKHNHNVCKPPNGISILKHELMNGKDTADHNMHTQAQVQLPVNTEQKPLVNGNASNHSSSNLTSGHTCIVDRNEMTESVVNGVIAASSQHSLNNSLNQSLSLSMDTDELSRDSMASQSTFNPDVTSSPAPSAAKRRRRALVVDDPDKPIKIDRRRKQFRSAAYKNNKNVTGIASRSGGAQIVVSSVQQASTSQATAPSTLPVPHVSGTTPVLRYACEWAQCYREFSKPSAVLYHIVTDHIPSDTSVCTECEWTNCEGTARLRWSLVTHVQDHHCTEQALRQSAYRRFELQSKGTTSIPEPRAPVAHPGYTRHAALEAIRRHALQMLPRELTDEPEGPVTKSVRLTSSLVLRNLARYSEEGRRRIRRHESSLSWLALSRLESSKALAQCLAELHADMNTSSSTATATVDKHNGS